MTSRIPIIVVASGRGSNFQAICNAIVENHLHAKVLALVSNVRDCGVVQIAKSLNIPVIVIENTKLTRAAHEELVLKELSKFQFEYIVLAGYMRIFSPTFIKEFSKDGFSKIINIHPSLLPSFQGMNAYAQAVEYGVKCTGCTVHFVDELCDHGAIIEQASFSLRGSESTEDCERIGIQLENKFYPAALQKLFHSKWQILGSAENRPRVVFS